MCDYTGKISAAILSELLYAHGVRDIVISPGSRNAPIVEALTRQGDFHLTTVVDERSSGFIGLGISIATRKPVAIVCTSGSAMLNYGPALAEAFYRSIPIIAITADRPVQWIDRMDSQTIRQAGTLSSVVKNQCDIPDINPSDSNQIWHANSLVNEVLLSAISTPQGPVHINMQFQQPLCGTEFHLNPQRIVRTYSGSERLTISQLESLMKNLTDKKILIVAGQMPADHRISKAFSKLAKIDSVGIIAENISNLKVPDINLGIDRILSLPELSDDLCPDVLISVGGNIISERFKSWIRNSKLKEHWHIGKMPVELPDTFRHLSKYIMADTAHFFSAMANYLERRNIRSEYSAGWRRISQAADSGLDSYIEKIPWCDMKAFARLLQMIPTDANLILSNGMSVRYSELFDAPFHSRDCNRGVSGIDGCTSTALGEAIKYPGMTVLITGDMSFRYDIGALGLDIWPTRLKVVVLNNNGGDIFRMVRTTRSSSIREEFFSAPASTKLPIKELSEALGFEYYKASDIKSLEYSGSEMFRSTKKSILEVITNPEINTDIYRNFFKTKSNQHNEKLD